MIVAQPALVAAQLFRQPLGGGIERDIVIGRRPATVDDDAAPDMQRQLGGDQVRLAGKDGMRLDRGSEIFSEQRFELSFDMRAQRLADIDLLARDRQLHGSAPFSLRGALARPELE